MSRLSVASAEKDTNNKGGEDGKGGNKWLFKCLSLYIFSFYFFWVTGILGGTIYMVMYSFSPRFINGEGKDMYMNMSHTRSLWHDQKLNADMLMLSFLNVTATQIYIQSPGIGEASEDWSNFKCYAFPVSYDICILYLYIASI